MDAVGHSRCRFSSRTATGRIVVAFHRLYVINGIDETCLSCDAMRSLGMVSASFLIAGEGLGPRAPRDISRRHLLRAAGDPEDVASGFSGAAARWAPRRWRRVASARLGGPRGRSLHTATAPTD